MNQKIDAALDKIRHYANIGWALLVIFALIGSLLHKEFAPVVAVLIALGWVLTTIVQRGITSYQTLRMHKDPEDTDKP